MHGNVAEWTLDEYQEDAYAKLGDGPVDAAAAVRWPTKVFPRSIRGGSWLRRPGDARSAARHKSEEKEWKLSDPNIPLSPWWYTEEAGHGRGHADCAAAQAALGRREEARLGSRRRRPPPGRRDRLREGRGALGVADKDLPAAVEAAEKLDGE